jgi:hypothetical protein
MSSPAVAPETSPSQPLFEPPDGRIYPEADKAPENGNSAPKNGKHANSPNSTSYLVPQLRRYQFTTATAKAAAAASVEARRIKANPPLPLPAQPDENALLTSKRLKQLSDEIARTIGLLSASPKAFCNKCMQGLEMATKDRAQLLNALDRLLERERILRGIAAPAPFRAPRQTRQSSNNTAEPL